MIDYTVEICERRDISSFIEEHHYSQSINGVMAKYSFKLLDREGILIGAALFGSLGMANAWRKYGEIPEDVLELRRLVLIDDTKRNAESFFIGAMLRWLRKNTLVKIIISYADPNHGHIGTIYRASNFKCLGKTSPGRVIVCGNRIYHDKAIRTKYKGELKPFASALKAALDSGTAEYRKTVPKIIYAYILRK